jgi:ATP-dependent protease ClpP protease subunit
MRRPRALQNYRTMLETISNTSPEAADALKNIKHDWYAIRNEADAEAEIFIYEEIGFWGITSDDFVKDLNNLKAKTINVRINSPGGSVWDAIAIYNALVSHSATVNVQVDALAASAASVIAMAGDKITMMRGSQMMIHDAIGVGMGNEAELKEYATWLGEQSNNIASIYAERAPSLDAEEWRAKMLAETWLFADEAVEMGLADGVYVKSKDTPPDPEKEPDEDPEEPEEESESEEETPDEDEEDPKPEDRMQAKHSLRNRGYKYTGRKEAPAPVTGFADLFDLWR